MIPPHHTPYATPRELVGENNMPSASDRSAKPVRAKRSQQTEETHLERGAIKACANPGAIHAQPLGPQEKEELSWARGMDHATVNQATCQCSGESAARRAAGKDNMGKHAVPSKCQQRKSRPYEETSRPDVPVPTTNLCTCPQHELLLQAPSREHQS